MSETNEIGEYINLTTDQKLELLLQRLDKIAIAFNALTQAAKKQQDDLLGKIITFAPQLGDVMTKIQSIYEWSGQTYNVISKATVK